VLSTASCHINPQIWEREKQYGIANLFSCSKFFNYQIFDVVGEKGELWLAKNQDDPSGQVGWIWSKHFAKLADS